MRGEGGLTFVVGGQFGSEAKGHVAARVATEDLKLGREHVAVRVAGPNAGHTAHDETGHAFAFRQLPVAAVTNPDATLVIAAGSEIEPEVLAHEVEWAERLGHKVRERLLIDPQATILTEHHKQAEAFGELQKRLGSTQKGIGAARADRVMRRAGLAGEVLGEEYNLVDTAGYLNRKLTAGEAHVLVEGTQGYGLGLHAGYYPKCTSSDCRAIDFASMAGIPPWTAPLQILVVCRVYPIRVAGDSGPLRDETSWSALGLPEERTTVTKKVRRVGLWDEELVARAVAANGGPPWTKLVITMLDQRYPAVAGLDGRLDEEKAATLHRAGASDWIEEIQERIGADVVAVGTGPRTMVLR